LNRDGTFRRFGYIGYKTEKMAKAALKHFNKTFIDTSRIEVEIAKAVCSYFLFVLDLVIT